MLLKSISAFNMVSCGASPQDDIPQSVAGAIIPIPRRHMRERAVAGAIPASCIHSNGQYQIDNQRGHTVAVLPCGRSERDV